MRYSIFSGVLATALVALPAGAFAQEAYTAKVANLRAGPDASYPVVAIIQAGTPLSLQGCESDYRWCDVIVGPYRGWLYAGNIAYPYEGSNVPLIGIGAAVGIGIIGFSVGEYWDHYYRSRPWYGQRQSWVDRPRPGFGRDRPSTPGWRPGDRNDGNRSGIRPGDRNDGNRTGVRPGSNRPSPAVPGVRPGNNRPSPATPGARPGSNRPSPAVPGVRPGSNRSSPARPAAGGGGNRPSQGKDDQKQSTR